MSSKKHQPVSQAPSKTQTDARALDHTADDVQGVAVALKLHADATLAEPIAPGLYLVATPIGNLSDITVRALHVLARADVIYCEDTRHSRRLTERFQLKTPMKPYHEHNAARQRSRILTALEQGSRVALISDAGTPLISDPGFKLVRAAAAAGHAVISLPGASAALVAVTSSGLPTDTVLFAGFLPPKDAGRRKRLAALAQAVATLVFFEAPHRLADSLSSLAAELGDRPACLARELTKLHEEVRRGTLKTLIRDIDACDIKGECVIVVGPPEERQVDDEEISGRLQELLTTMSLKDAARHVAEEFHIGKGRVYDLGLDMKRRRM